MQPNENGEYTLNTNDIDKIDFSKNIDLTDNEIVVYAHIYMPKWYAKEFGYKYESVMSYDIKRFVRFIFRKFGR